MVLFLSSSMVPVRPPLLLLPWEPSGWYRVCGPGRAFCLHSLTGGTSSGVRFVADGGGAGRGVGRILSDLARYARGSAPVWEPCCVWEPGATGMRTRGIVRRPQLNQDKCCVPGWWWQFCLDEVREGPHTFVITQKWCHGSGHWWQSAESTGRGPKKCWRPWL